jgi:hypothetical protein
MSRHLIAAAFVASLAISCHAQTTARVVGTVRDSSSAVMPGVSVRITNLQTNAVRQIVTDGSGDYVATNLAIGSYEISAESAGFKRAVQRPVVLDVDQTARVDFTLQTGELNETVTVSEAAPLIESERSSLGQVVENQTIVQLPLNGRNFIRLGTLVPGATPGAPNNSVARSREGGEALTTNGQRAEYNNYMLDGMDNNENLFGVAVVVPSIDAIQEFKVQTANYSAEYGRGSGAIVNVAIKSGTNEFHGSAYEFLRNDKLDARNTFALTKNPLRQNQFGAAFGGPVWLPKLYNGRNRTFFFFDWEGQRIRSTSTNRFIVPTLAQRQGSFAGLPTIYDPQSLDAQGNRLPFAGNQITTARLNGAALKALSYYPQPNSSDPAGNYVQTFSSPTNNSQINVRGDQKLSSLDQLFGRYSKTDSDQYSPSINFAGGATKIATQGGVIGWTRVLSPRSVNELRIGFQRYVYDLLPDGLGLNGPELLGLPTLTADPTFLHYPTVGIRNFTSFGNGTLLYRVENSYQLVEALSVTTGRHTVKLGGDFRLYQANNSQPQFTSGDYTFSGAFTGVKGSQYTNGLADFLLGLPAQEQILNLTGYDSARLRNKRLEAYVQDDFKATSRLTLNLGLRWERDGAWTEANNRFAYFDFGTGQVVYPKSAGMPFTTFPYPFRFDNIDAMKQPTNKAFAPRFGFALRPFADNRTVIRAAYGIFFGQPIANVILNDAFTPPPFQLKQTVISDTATPQLQFGIFPGIKASTLIPTNPAFFTSNPYSYTNGYVQQWNFGVERQLASTLAVKAAYVGSKGTHLEERREGNPALPPRSGRGELAPPLPGFPDPHVPALQRIFDLSRFATLSGKAIQRRAAVSRQLHLGQVD